MKLIQRSFEILQGDFMKKFKMSSASTRKSDKHYDFDKSTLHERLGAFFDIFKNCQRKLYQ